MRALCAIALFVLCSCYPSALVEELRTSKTEVLSAAPGLITNPANPNSWSTLLTVAAAAAAAGVAGPSAARKVRSFLGKPHG